MPKPAPKPVTKVDDKEPEPGKESVPNGENAASPAKVESVHIEQTMEEWTQNCVQAGAIPIALVAVIPASAGGQARVFSAMAKNLPLEMVAGVVATVGLSLKNQARGGKISPISVPQETAEKAADFPTER